MYIYDIWYANYINYGTQYIYSIWYNNIYQLRYTLYGMLIISIMVQELYSIRYANYINYGTQYI